MYSWASSRRASSWQTCCCRSKVCENKTSLFSSSEPQRLTINHFFRPSTRNIAWTDAFTVHVTLRPRLVTRGRCHVTQERVAKVPASWEDTGPYGGVRWNRCTWRSGGTGLDQNVARCHRDMFDLEYKGESVVVRFI